MKVRETERSHIETQENSYNPDSRLRQTSGIKKGRRRRRKGLGGWEGKRGDTLSVSLGTRRTPNKAQGRFASLH